MPGDPKIGDKEGARKCPEFFAHLAWAERRPGLAQAVMAHVRVTIWSEGLATLAKHHVAPDSSWRGQWVSVTGLVDSKYQYPTKRNTHVGITVRDTTQLRKISEVEARR